MRIALSSRNFLLLVLLSVAALARTAAQQLPPPLPPIEPAKPLPASQPHANLSVTTTEVLVPTLVEKPNGEIIYGLKPKDFILEDNGVPQKIRVQEEMDTAPVALVVAVELGGASVLEFDKLAKLGPLLDLFLADPRSEVALVGFDSTQHLIQDFTHAGDAVNDDLKNLEPGDGGAAILDTVSYSANLLESQPKSYRRVLLLISERRDHGSKHTRPEALIKQIGESDVLVLSVSFSPSAAEFAHDLKDSGEDRTMNMVSTLVMMVKAFKKNVSKEIAVHERRRVHDLHRRQEVRAAGGGCGQARAQPLSDHLQPLEPDAGAAYHSRAYRRGLRGADCGAGELLAGYGRAVAGPRNRKPGESPARHTRGFRDLGLRACMVRAGFPSGRFMIVSQ